MPLNKHTVQPVDPVLTRFSVDYANDRGNYYADKLFPVVPVATESGTYYTFSSTKDRYAAPGKTRRAPGALYGRGQLNVASSTYQTQEDGWEMQVDRRIQDTAVAPYNAERSAVETCTDVVLIRRELNAISAITNTTTFASYTAALAVADRWDNSSSEPIQYIDGIRNTIRGNCGMNPNTMVIDWATWLKIKEHPVVLDRVKITQDKIVTEDLLAKLFGVDKLYVTLAQYNSAEEGQTVSLADVMSKKCFLAYVNPAPALDRPSVGYLIQKEGFTADKYYEDQTRSDIVRCRVNEVHKIVAADCGYLLTTVIS